MDLEPTGVPEEVIGSLKSCFVEGDAEQRRRERKIRRRALAFSVIAQTIALTALLLYPLLGKGERISLSPDRLAILPPYRHGGDAQPLIDHPRSAANQKHVCIVCFNAHNLPTLSHAGGPVGRASLELGSDSEIGFPTGPDIPGGLPTADRSPEKPREEIKPTTGRQRVSEGVQMAQLIHRIEPVYPTLARQIRREGRVELRAIIATDGSIQSLEVVSGDPLFYQSALEAVGQWRYRATILDGRAVEIDTRITVNYTLNH